MRNIITEIIENLNLKQRQIINNYIQISINNLSNRKKNAISYYLDNNFKIKHFSSLIFEKSNFDANKLQNIGGSSIYDIKEFIENVKKFTYSVSTITDESELNRFNNSFYIQSSFNISNIPKEVIDANSIFTFTNFLFENNCIFEKKIYCCS
jgi:hypothetical protein